MQHELPDALSEEFLFKCLLVMIYKQFIVSTNELIMLSWQPIFSYNCHNMGITLLFYHFFKLQFHILQHTNLIWTPLLVFHVTQALGFSNLTIKQETSNMTLMHFETQLSQSNDLVVITNLNWLRFHHTLNSLV